MFGLPALPGPVGQALGLVGLPGTTEGLLGLGARALGNAVSSGTGRPSMWNANRGGGGGGSQGGRDEGHGGEIARMLAALGGSILAGRLLRGSGGAGSLPPELQQMLQLSLQRQQLQQPRAAAATRGITAMLPAFSRAGGAPQLPSPPSGPSPGTQAGGLSGLPSWLKYALGGGLASLPIWIKPLIDYLQRQQGGRPPTEPRLDRDQGPAPGTGPGYSYDWERVEPEAGTGPEYSYGWERSAESAGEYPDYPEYSNPEYPGTGGDYPGYQSSINAPGMFTGQDPFALFGPQRQNLFPVDFSQGPPPGQSGMFQPSRYPMHGAQFESQGYQPQMSGLTPGSVPWSGPLPLPEVEHPAEGTGMRLPTWGTQEPNIPMSESDREWLRRHGLLR